jgi:hypothetical protein
VSPLVSLLRVAATGSSEVSIIRDRFALIHVGGTFDVGAKRFSYGVVAVFSDGGAMVGSATLR